MKLNLGCGPKRPEGYVNVDAQPMTEPDVVCDLSRERWPFDDDSVTDVMASHILEHIGPGPDPYFHFWKELWRVCAHDAKIEIKLPHPRHDGFLNDPTHQRAVTPDGLAMFSKKIVEDLESKGQHWTPFYKFLGIDFDMVWPVQIVFDEAIRQKILGGESADEWMERVKYMNNIAAEYLIEMRAVKRVA